MSSSEIQAFVDRIEGDKAVLLVGEKAEAVIIPAKYLPKEAGEGAVLTIEIRFDAEKTAEASENIKSIIQRLTKKSK